MRLRRAQQAHHQTRPGRGSGSPKGVGGSGVASPCTNRSVARIRARAGPMPVRRLVACTSPSRMRARIKAQRPQVCPTTRRGRAAPRAAGRVPARQVKGAGNTAFSPSRAPAHPPRTGTSHRDTHRRFRGLHGHAAGAELEGRVRPARIPRDVAPRAWLAQSIGPDSDTPKRRPPRRPRSCSETAGPAATMRRSCAHSPHHAAIVLRRQYASNSAGIHGAQPLRASPTA